MRSWVVVIASGVLVQTGCQFQSGGVGGQGGELVVAGTSDSPDMTSGDAPETSRGGHDGGDTGDEISTSGDDATSGTGAVGSDGSSGGSPGEGETSSTTGGASEGATVGSSSDGGIDLPVFIDRGLLARYFVDEAASGTIPTALLDAAPEPLDLPIQYADVTAFGESDGNRGLVWAQNGVGGGAFAEVKATKIEQGLHGRNGATFELVLDVSNLSTLGSRFFDIGRSSELDVTLGAARSNHLVFAAHAGDTYLDWPVDLTAGRIVVHVVYDSALPEEEERVVLYVDGMLVQGTNTQVVPNQGQPLSIQTSGWFALGNRVDGGRSFGGLMHYAAIYNVAFTPEEAEHNADILLVADDAQ